MKKCEYCGFENEDDAMFCGGCGHKLKENFEESKEEFTPLIPVEVGEKDVPNEKLVEEDSNSNEEETDSDTPETDSEEEENLGFDVDEPEDLGFEMEKELEEIDELDFGPEEESVKEVKCPAIPPVVKQEQKVEEDLGFDLEEEPAEEIECQTRPRVNNNVNVDNTPKPNKPNKSNKGIIIAAVIAGVAIIGAAGGGFMAYQNSKHQAEIAALKADQQKKDEEAQKEAEEAKKEMEAAKKEAKEAKKEAEKAREESKASKSEKSHKSSSSSNDDFDYDDYPDTGSYVANYNMKERSGASLSASQVGSIQKGQVLEIVDVIDNGDGSYWGELSNGHYVCIKDNSYIYLS